MYGTIYLRVKIKSLAEEAKIIRHEERKSSGLLKHNLSSHRRTEVRKEARAAQLAYAYIRGHSYCSTEFVTHKRVDFTRVQQLVKKYGSAEQFTNLKNWFPS